MIALILSTFLFVMASPKTLPPEINKCRLSDPNLDKCMEVSVPDAVKKLSHGNKDIGVIPLDPLFIQRVDFGNSSTGTVRIHQIYENINFYGIADAITLTNLEIDFGDANCHWTFKTITPKVVMKADYTMKGQLLIFPINGHGKCTNTLDDVQSEFGIKCEKYTKKNKKYIRMTDFSYKIQPTKVVFDFDNIIDGNEQLSKEVVKTMNENSLSVYKEIGSAFDEVIARIWKETINAVFSRVPEDELFLP